MFLAEHGKWVFIFLQIIFHLPRMTQDNAYPVSFLFVLLHSANISATNRDVQRMSLSISIPYQQTWKMIGHTNVHFNQQFLITSNNSYPNTI